MTKTERAETVAAAEAAGQDFVDGGWAMEDVELLDGYMTHAIRVDAKAVKLFKSTALHYVRQALGVL